MRSARSTFRDSQIIRFLLAGGTSATTEFLAFAILIRLTNNVFWPALISFVCGLSSSYILNSRVVFGSEGRSGKRKAAQVTAFLALGIFNALFSSWLVVLLSGSLPRLLAKLFIIAFIAVWNFIVMKWLIFNDSEK